MGGRVEWATATAAAGRAGRRRLRLPSRGSEPRSGCSDGARESRPRQRPREVLSADGGDSFAGGGGRGRARDALGAEDAYQRATEAYARARLR